MLYVGAAAGCDLLILKAKIAACAAPADVVFAVHFATAVPNVAEM
jgi:hypothetical protein